MLLVIHDGIVTLDKDQASAVVHLSYLIRHQDLPTKDIIIVRTASMAPFCFPMGFFINRILAKELADVFMCPLLVAAKVNKRVMR